MQYQEAVSLLLQGKFITRPQWSDECGYLGYFPGISHFLRVTTQPKPQVTPWAASVEDSISADWVEVNPFELKLAEPVQQTDAA